MKNIKQRFKDYLTKSSKFKIISDFVFYVFIILIIIPGTRKDISSFFIKLTMRKPSISENKPIASLSSQDYLLDLRDLNGQFVNFEQFKGEVILFNVWATWCPPCRAEMPSLQKLYNDYKDKMAIVLVTDEEISVVKNFLDEHNYDLPVYFQASAYPELLHPKAFPTTFLINQKGEILIRKTGAANWNSESFRTQIDRMLNL